MASDNKKYVARVPIVPDDMDNGNEHVNHELVMDFTNNDLYVKLGDYYGNITGKIKEEVKQIHDGSSVIHVVTEQTLPPIKERSENNWYYVIIESEDSDGGTVAITSYIYYGLIKTYDTSKNYLLIGQNVSSGEDVVPITILEGYCPCFYVPISYGATFKNTDTGAVIPATIEDRVYAMDTSLGTYVAYDVYSLELYDAGDYKIQIDLSGAGEYVITFDTNQSGTIEGLVLPTNINVADGDCIGEITDPTWTNARYEFHGWSTSKISEIIIDPTKYKPNDSMTLFAWFTYNDDQSLIEYEEEDTTEIIDVLPEVETETEPEIDWESQIEPISGEEG